ncbi:MAG TPA: hypothetical protein VFS77_10210 [Pyrinomonadaceae bacterium]|nr:hypothetical protein [Pyrinomonadaceae bacterium]
MPTRIHSYMKLFIAAFLLVSCCLVEADAQTKKRRTRRSKPPAPKPVITNPPIAPPTETAAGDVKIISTADAPAEPAQSPEPAALPAKKVVVTESDDESREEDMKRTINTLSNQVNRLNDKLSQMQDDERYHLDMERLTRAEQRAEQLRAQLFETESKMADIDVKLEQIEYAIKPENIDRATQGYGSTRPEEAREARRRQLESERTRLIAQKKLLETSRSRLGVACQSADQEVDTLRAKLQQRRDQMDAQPPSSDRTRSRRPEQ